MDMTETATLTPARKPKKKRARTKRKVSTAPKKASDGVYAGLTAANCATACNADRCVISGRGICAHPYKGGLQASTQDPDATRRLNEAKRVIGKRKLDIAAEQDGGALLA